MGHAVRGQKHRLARATHAACASCVPCFLLRGRVYDDTWDLASRGPDYAHHHLGTSLYCLCLCARTLVRFSRFVRSILDCNRRLFSIMKTRHQLILLEHSSCSDASPKWSWGKSAKPLARESILHPHDHLQHDQLSAPHHTFSPRRSSL